MHEPESLHHVRLVPVVELPPYRFDTKPRTSPNGSCADLPEEWFRHWSDCLADSGLHGLHPVQRGSWHVPTSEFRDADQIHIFLRTTFQEWGGIDSLCDLEESAVLEGGLALLAEGNRTLIEPTCCGDLADAIEWKKAAAYEGPEWQMVWIGHPWISVRYEAPWLILSAPHETSPPCERWRVLPAALHQAWEEATNEQIRFAHKLAKTLPTLGFHGDADDMGHRLAGLRPPEGESASN